MAAARQKEMNESITDVTTTTLVVRLAGFIAAPSNLNPRFVLFPAEDFCNTTPG
jgi:hypothetical protein